MYRVMSKGNAADEAKQRLRLRYPATLLGKQNLGSFM
jgi:hypothetical protein